MTRNSFKKEDFSKEIHDKIGLSFNLSKKIIDDLLIVLSEHLKNNKLILKNIGRFKILNKSERVGRNPKTGEDFVIKKRKSVSFITSENLIKKIND
tara:strand:- start:245 stop:532 length:288 start_codon:yes stop_codon:yes gene_type:complete